MLFDLPEDSQIIKAMIVLRLELLNNWRDEYVRLNRKKKTSSRPDLYDSLLEIVIVTAEELKEQIKEIRNGTYTPKQLPN